MHDVERVVLVVFSEFLTKLHQGLFLASRLQIMNEQDRPMFLHDTVCRHLIARLICQIEKESWWVVNIVLLEVFIELALQFKVQVPLNNRIVKSQESRQSFLLHDVSTT